MTDRQDLISSAAAQVEWLAGQPRRNLLSVAEGRYTVRSICESARFVRYYTERTLRDIDPQVPATLRLPGAADALTWCNTIERGGNRAIAAIRMATKDRAGELEHAWHLIDSEARALRDALGADAPVLTREQMRMVEENMGLVRWAVARWAPTDNGEYSTEDAHQDAAIGLMRAVQLFDPSRGFTLGTFAYAYLYSGITQGEGRAKGKNYRSAKASGEGGQHRDVHLDTPISTPHSTATERFVTLGDRVADPRPDDYLAAAEWAVVGPQILEARNRVCRSNEDLRIFDTVASLDPSTSRTQAFRILGAELGVSHEWVRTRWQALRAELGEELDHLRAG